MKSAHAVRLACLIAIAGVTAPAYADSFASSASSAGSASSGSVSASLHGSSDSSSGRDKTASGDYRIVDVAQAPDRVGVARLTMRADDPQNEIVLDLPQNIVQAQGLALGDVVHAQQRVYGFEFARGDTHEAFYLVLADAWYDALTPRPVGL